MIAKVKCRCQCQYHREDSRYRLRHCISRLVGVYDEQEFHRERRPSDLLHKDLLRGSFSKSVGRIQKDPEGFRGRPGKLTRMLMCWVRERRIKRAKRDEPRFLTSEASGLQETACEQVDEISVVDRDYKPENTQNTLL